MNDLTRIGNLKARLVILLVCLAIGKFLLRFVDTDSLYCLLGPTSFIVHLFTGINFVWISGEGFTSNQNIVIEASCAGAGFFLLSLALSCFHLLNLPFMRMVKYLPLFLLLGFVATVLVNSFRIISSIYVLNQSMFSPSMLHKVVGIVTFLSGLLVYNYILSHLSRKLV